MKNSGHCMSVDNSQKEGWNGSEYVLEHLSQARKSTSYFDLTLRFAYVHHRSNAITKQRRDKAQAFVFDFQDSEH